MKASRSLISRYNWLCEEDNFHLDKSFPLSAEPHRLKPVFHTLHYHRPLEVTLITRGQGRFVINGRVETIRSGDIFVLHHVDVHRAKSIGRLPCDMMVLYFEPDLILRHSSNGVECLEIFNLVSANMSWRLSGRSPNIKRIGRIILELHQEFERKQTGWQNCCLANLLLILTGIRRELEAAGRYQQNCSHQKFEYMRFQKVFEYIEQNLHRKISISNLTKIVGVSEPHFRYLFKRNFGMTITDHLQKSRIQHAQALLQSTPLTISEVCYRCGFNSLSYFNSLFRRNCGVTPGDFRASSFTAKKS